MKIEQKTWDDLSIQQARQIENVQNFKGSNMNKVVQILSIIFEKDPDYFLKEIGADILSDYLEFVAQFLSTPIPINFDKFMEYEIDGKQWILVTTKKQMTGGQLITYMTIKEEHPNNIAKLLSTVLIPKGGCFGEYADGEPYDIGEFERIIDEQFPFTKARGIANFFWQASLTSQIFTLRSSRKKLLKEIKRETSSEKRETMREAVRKINEAIQTIQASTAHAI